MIEDAHEELVIDDESDIVVVRKTVRNAAVKLNFGLTDVTRIVTAASELARNVFIYAGSGVMKWRTLEASGVTGLELTFEDHGPGISDLEQAMQRGYSTSGGLGLGMKGVQRLMDEMEVKSQIGEGTTVVVKKWCRRY
jgi:serine/threonine-protein kinase RsbT